MKKILVILSIFFFNCEAEEELEKIECKESDYRLSIGCIADYNPVCGCNNKTYYNECEANAWVIGIIKVGECDN